MKNIFKASIAALAVSHATLVTAIDFEGSSPGATVNAELKGTTTNLWDTVQGFIDFLIGFLYLVAVIYALWGGFNILTAGGDEEKVKKGKTVIIQAIIGIIVIFLASSIITFVVDQLLAPAVVAGA